jgi:hypothetical protein
MTNGASWNRKYFIARKKRGHASVSAPFYRRGPRLQMRRPGARADSAFLKQYSGLEKEIVLVGVLDRFEIWSRENWDRKTG